MGTCTKGLWCKQALAFLSFCTFNVALNEFNPWALKGGQFPGFDFPVFYGMWHMLFSSTAALLLVSTVAKPETGMPSVAQFWMYSDGLAVIACCTALNVSLNNLSLTLVSLFINQVIKASSPMPTMVFECLLARKTFTVGVIMSVVAIVAGSALAPYYKVAHSKAGSNELLGIIAVCVSMFAASLKPVVAMLMMSGSSSRPKLAPTVMLFYDSSLSFLFMFVYWVCGPERSPSIQYLGGAPTDAPYLDEYNSTLLGLGILLAGSTMAFCFNLSCYYYVMLTSALTSTIGSLSLKIFLIFIAAVQDRVNDPISWTGIGIAATSTVAYAFLSFEERPRTADDDEGASSPCMGTSGDSPRLSSSKGDVPMGATEATPLKGAIRA